MKRIKMEILPLVRSQSWYSQKQWNNRIIKILIIGLLIFYSCNNQTKPVIDDTIALGNSQSVKDLNLFLSSISTVRDKNELDSLLQVLLIPNEDSILIQLFQDQGNSEKSSYLVNSQVASRHPNLLIATSREIEALHLICAIFYRDYFHAHSRYLGSSESISVKVYGSDTVRTEFNSETTLPNPRSTKEEIQKAWQLVHEWAERNEFSFQTARIKNSPPFMNQDLFWLY